eukprot:TRINITY_DN1993_c0_g1_i1.p1 TRINITY_DN1993_c0_g1~~TRINITY_DN1993_c0_g1_i1.p1  ORF type:complete len:102 (-),score=5.86 TRINITY_DN1993_c0_g1_i1:48-353(-)
MKYQQLENLECGWKWQYLVKKWKDGVAITQYIDSSEAKNAVDELLKLEHQPTGVLEWINDNMSPDLDNKLKQHSRQNVKTFTMLSKYNNKEKSNRFRIIEF